MCPPVPGPSPLVQEGSQAPPALGPCRLQATELLRTPHQALLVSCWQDLNSLATVQGGRQPHANRSSGPGPGTKEERKNGRWRQLAVFAASCYLLKDKSLCLLGKCWQMLGKFCGRRCEAAIVSNLEGPEASPSLNVGLNTQA